MLRILAGVDVVLGLLLTLIVFKPGKPRLKFDMSCIILLQVGALIYGGMIIDQQRPAFVIFGIDRFISIAAAEVAFDQLRYPELQRRFSIGPLFAQARLRDNPQQRQDLLFGVLTKGERDLEYRAELYEPYQPDLTQLRRRRREVARCKAVPSGLDST